MCVWTKEVLLSRSESNTMILVINVALFFIFNIGRIFGSVYVNFSFTFTKKSQIGYGKVRSFLVVTRFRLIAATRIFSIICFNFGTFGIGISN